MEKKGSAAASIFWSKCVNERFFGVAAGHFGCFCQSGYCRFFDTLLAAHLPLYPELIHACSCCLQWVLGEAAAAMGVVMKSFEHVDFAYDLDDYASIAGLPPALAELRNEAVQTARQFAGRRLVMISAEDARGSLIENIPAQVALLRACGIQAEWLRFAPIADQGRLHRLCMTLFWEINAAIRCLMSTTVRLMPRPPIAWRKI